MKYIYKGLCKTIRKYKFATYILTNMENKQALKIIEKIQKELFQNKFIVEDIVSDLKKLREITLELNNPVVTKALRLAYEHLDANNGFFIGIPDDEPLDSKDNEIKANISDANNVESFDYFLSFESLEICRKRN